MARPTPIEGLNEDTDLAVGLKRLLMGRLSDLLKYEEGLHRVTQPDVSPVDGPGAQEEAEELAELIHDARVATRRLRAALALYPFSPELRRGEMADQVAAMGRALGAVRDLDILLAWLHDHAGQGDEEERAGIALLAARQREYRQEELRRMVDPVGRFCSGEVVELLTTLALLRTPGGRLGGKAVRQGLKRRLDKVDRWLGRALPGKPDFVHELRIAAKKLRYHAELLCGIVPQAESIAAALSPLQEGLGHLHDCDARLKWLPEYAAHAPRRELAGVILLLRLTHEERRLRWAKMQEELLRWQEEGRLQDLSKGL